MVTKFNWLRDKSGIWKKHKLVTDSWCWANMKDYSHNWIFFTNQSMPPRCKKCGKSWPGNAISDAFYSSTKAII